MTAAPRIDVWVKWTAIAAVVVGVALRLHRAAVIALSFDECMQLLPVHSNSFAEAYEHFAEFAHPPLFLMLTYPLGALTLTELGARIVPLLSSILLPVVLYIWLRDRAGLIAACTAVTIISLSSNWITLTPQVRSYSLAFLFFVLSLMWLDQAIDRDQLIRLGLAGSALILAILSDYSLAIVCPAITLYGFARLHEVRARRPLWLAWALAIVLAMFTFGMLYWFQIRLYVVFAADFSTSWLRQGFRVPGESLAHFLIWSTYKQFAYLSSRQLTGVLFALPFLLSLPFVSVAWRVLLVMPFATGLTLCLLRLFAFGQTRHSAIVSLLIAVGVGLAAQRWLATRPRAWLAVGPALVACCYFTASPHPMDWPDDQLDPHAFRAAAEFAGSLPTAGAAVLTTGHTRDVLQYYRLIQGAPLLNLATHVYGELKSEYLIVEIAAIRANARLRPSDPVFVVDAGNYPFKYPPSQPSGPIRKFGPMRFWRLEGTGSLPATPLLPRPLRRLRVDQSRTPNFRKIAIIGHQFVNAD
ncbi:MAG: glycosyltransferase family 39 protein [Acidobacteriota bacterium]